MKISFIAGSEEAQMNITPPTIAKRFIPPWYRDIAASTETDNVKKCVPFLDALTFGYVQTTWADIDVVVAPELEVASVVDYGKPPQLSYRDTTDIAIGPEYHQIEFVWKRYWAIELPKGYSALITTPLNRTHLPFLTLSGIVDFDSYQHMQVGNIPFFIKRDFVGVIPAGTPMFQIIPIKREEWTSDIQNYDETFWTKKTEELESSEGYYKKQFWNRKKFD